jgi:hypothetical protein
MNRRLLLVWLVLAGFMLGVAVCPFGDLNGRETDDQLVKERTTMPTVTNRVTTATEMPAVDGTILAGMQTATFALG